MNNPMTVKVARIYPLKSDSALKAFVDVVVNDVVLIKGLRVIDGRNGLFVSMPHIKAKDDKWYETVRCLSKGFKEDLAQNVLSTYMTYDETSKAA